MGRIKKVNLGKENEPEQGNLRPCEVYRIWHKGDLNLDAGLLFVADVYTRGTDGNNNCIRINPDGGMTHGDSEYYKRQFRIGDCVTNRIEICLAPR